MYIFFFHDLFFQEEGEGCRGVKKKTEKKKL